MDAVLLVLNYNGWELLRWALPSVLEAAAACRWRCQVAVVDNGSTDGSWQRLKSHFPHVHRHRMLNRGLCSFNEVARLYQAPVLVLLNNDIYLTRECLDPWLAPLLESPDRGGDPRCWMTAPCGWHYATRRWEGYKTALGWRWGLVQATAFFPGHESCQSSADETACAGAALAVRREVFLHLGGFDPLYLPGRLEDLDLCYRAYLAGYHARYVPQAQVWHLGAATFARELGAEANDHLALRNTLLFQWKNLHHWRHRLRQRWGVALRLARDVLQAPLARSGRFAFWRAWREARQVYRRHGSPRAAANPHREKAFFERYAPQRLAALSGRPLAAPAPPPPWESEAPSPPRAKAA